MKNLVLKFWSIKKIVIFLFVFTFLFIAHANANDNGNELYAFRKIKNIENLNLSVTSVVEVPLDSKEFEWEDFAIFEKESGEYKPSFYYQNIADKNTPYTIKANGEDLSLKLKDKKQETFVEFSVPAEGVGRAIIEIETEELIKSESLYFSLSKFVALPNSIKVKIIDRGVEKLIFSKAKYVSRSVLFPTYLSNKWIIEFEYSQPLRIAEFELREKKDDEPSREGLRFLALPDMNYVLYFDSDRNTSIKTGEASNLYKNEGVVVTKNYITENNSLYVKSDVDDDGVPDEIDNCIQHANADQTDLDNNKRGDLCDDFDRDGVVNIKDNCQNHPNNRQTDTDGDGVGDSCDDEESRLTEKYPFLPWIGMGLVLAVVASMFISTFRKKNINR